MGVFDRESDEAAAAQGELESDEQGRKEGDRVEYCA